MSIFFAWLTKHRKPPQNKKKVVVFFFCLRLEFLFFVTFTFFFSLSSFFLISAFTFPHFQWRCTILDSPRPLSIIHFSFFVSVIFVVIVIVLFFLFFFFLMASSQWLQYVRHYLLLIQLLYQWDSLSPRERDTQRERERERTNLNKFEQIWTNWTNLNKLNPLLSIITKGHTLN